jgi:sugar lactone lactonase YvrE
MAQTGKEKGFILITMLFLLLLVAVTAMSLNIKSGMQAKMTANQSANAQTYFGQLAVMERAVWELTKNPWGRAAGSPKTYHGETFTMQVSNSSVTGYNDAVIVSVTPPNASALKTSARYYLSDLLYLNRPDRVCHDSGDNLYIADASSHSIFKVDRFTNALIRVAGNGTSGSTGDGGPAVNAQLNNPSGVWVDSFGEIYIADSGNHRIRKVGAGGYITTVAGTGTAGYAGNNGLATSAQLNNPAGIFIDSLGNIFIADTGNHVVRKVNTATGNIETVAGTLGSAGYSGNGGLALSATLNNPYGVYVSTVGHVYIADTNNCWIRKVDASTKIIILVAGNTTALPPVPSYSGDNSPALGANLNYPRDVFVQESTGEAIITIADTGNHRIRSFLEGGNIATLAGTGVASYAGDGALATSAAIDTPRGVTMKSTGELVIADSLNSCLRQVTPVSKIISTVTGMGNPTFDQPRHIALDASGNVYIADMSNHRIRKMDPSGRVTTVAGTGVAGYSGDGGMAMSARLNGPASVAVDGSGNIFIADTNNCCIRKVDAAGTITTVAGTGVAGYTGDNGPATSARLRNPYGVKVNASNIYIADYDNNCVRKVNTSGIITTAAGICDRNVSTYSGDNGPATSARLNGPVDIYLDAAGNIFIADLANNRVRKVDAATQIISTFAGTGTAGYSGDGGPAISAKLGAPRGLFADAAGNLYIADRDRHVVRVVSGQDDSRKGYIYTLAGVKTGTAGYNWAGVPLPAVDALLNSPSSVAMAETRGGRIIYISDRDNNRIRMLTLKIEKKLY